MSPPGGRCRHGLTSIAGNFILKEKKKSVNLRLTTALTAACDSFCFQRSEDVFLLSRQKKRKQIQTCTKVIQSFCSNQALRRQFPASAVSVSSFLYYLYLACPERSANFFFLPEAFFLADSLTDVAASTLNSSLCVSLKYDNKPHTRIKQYVAVGVMQPRWQRPLVSTAGSAFFFSQEKNLKILLLLLFLVHFKINKIKKIRRSVSH